MSSSFLGGRTAKRNCEERVRGSGGGGREGEGVLKAKVANKVDVERDAKMTKWRRSGRRRGRRRRRIPTGAAISAHA
jgi:hypothetical protein